MPDADTARALLAGLIAGSAAAFATTAIALVAMSRDARWLARSAKARVPLPLLGVVVVNAMMLAWTALGLLLGAGYLRAEAARPAGVAGSANGLFTLLVTVAVAVVLIAAGFVRGRVTRPMGATALVALIAFGWLLPALAG